MRIVCESYEKPYMSIIFVALMSKCCGQHWCMSSTFPVHAVCSVLPFASIVSSSLGQSFACRKLTIK